MNRREKIKENQSKKSNNKLTGVPGRKESKKMERRKLLKN